MASTRRSRSRTVRAGLKGRSPSFYFMVIVFIGAIAWMAWDIARDKKSEPSTRETSSPPPASSLR